MPLTFKEGLDWLEQESGSEPDDDNHFELDPKIGPFCGVYYQYENTATIPEITWITPVLFNHDWSDWMIGQNDLVGLFAKVSQDIAVVRSQLRNLGYDIFEEDGMLQASRTMPSNALPLAYDEIKRVFYDYAGPWSEDYNPTNP